MPELSSYDYAVVRVVPSVDRGEFVNAGVILHATSLGFLAAQIALDEARLLKLSPTIDAETIRAHLGSMQRICVGGPEAGPIGQLSRSQRFHWLVSPRSTMIQTSAVHSGLCEDPQLELTRLFTKLVEVPPAGGS